MKIIRPQQCIVLRNACQTGEQAMLGISVVAGWHLGCKNHFMHEAGMWAALAAAPMSLRVLDTCEPKPFAEFLLAGHACGTGQATVREVDLQVGVLRKRLRVSGNPLPSGIEPFASMPLDHPYAYGGTTEPRNPLGRGADPAAPAPNLALRLDADRVDEQAPLAATTPLPHGFRDRAAFLGATGSWPGSGYVERIYPGLPDTVDPRYFQSAAPDQWLSSPEWPAELPFHLAGVGAAPIIGSVPAVDARALVWLHSSPATPLELTLQRKTVWFLPDSGCGLIVFTGTLPLNDLLEEPVKDLIVGLDWNAERRAPAHYVDVRQRRCARDATGFESMLDDELMPEGADMDVISRLGDHPQSLMSQPGPREPAEASRHFSRIRETIAAMAAPNEVAGGSCQLDAALSLVGTCSRETDWRLRLAGPQACTDLDIVGADLTGMAFEHRTLTRVRFVDCALAGAMFRGTTLDDCHFTRCNLGDADLGMAVLRHVHMDGVDLACTNFRDATLRNCAFERSGMTASLWDRASVSASLFRDTDLRSASFRQATISDTIASACGLASCNLDEGTLDSCMFEQCVADGVRCHGVSMKRTTIQDGSWRGLDIRHGELHSVTFGGSVVLRDASFGYSRMVKVGFATADLHASRFDHCDLEEVCFLRASLVDAIFRHCHAPLAIMREADLKGSTVSSSSLAQASLYGANLQGAFFEACNLAGADLAMTRQDAATRFDGCLDAGMRRQPVHGDARRANP